MDFLGVGVGVGIVTSGSMRKGKLFDIGKDTDPGDYEDELSENYVDELGSIYEDENGVL